MKGLKRLGLGIAALTAALAVAAFIAGSVLAVSGSMSISSASVEPGGSGSVELSSDVGDPGLGAWTVDITYDPSVITITDCDTEEGGVCNDAFADDTVRITGASANGVDGAALLGTIFFDCAEAEASTDLTLTLDVFADATIGNPAPIEPATTNDGEVACEEPAEEPTPTTGVAGPPQVGTGPSSSSDSNWVIVAIVGAGLFALASLTALRLSTRRS